MLDMGRFDRRVQEALGREGPVHISGFSDAQRGFDPEILEPVMQGLLAESLAACLPTTKIGRITPELIRVCDSTLWKVVPRMGWADDEELARILAAEEAARQRRSPAKKKD